MGAKTDLTGRSNNLNLLRFLAALLVVFSHAFALTNRADPISSLSKGQTTGGQLAVLMFFFYGGLLIMKSVEGKKSAKAFFKTRVTRIFPSLWIVVLCSVFVLGAALTRLPLIEYIKSGRTWMYLLNGLLIPVHALPGVFEDNSAMATVNGALWTLPVEFACYILCYLFYKVGLSRNRRPLYLLPLVVALAFGARAIFRNIEALQNAVFPVLFFYLGMLCYIYCKSIPLNGYLALGAAACLVLAVYIGVFPFAVCVFYPYILLYLGFGTPKTAAGFGLCGLELSYAIYLTGFPIQQTLFHFDLRMPPMVNFALGACAAICLSVPITLLDRRISARIRR